MCFRLECQNLYDINVLCENDMLIFIFLGYI